MELVILMHIYRRAELVAPGAGKDLVGIEVIGCSGQDGGSWHVWRRGSGWSATERRFDRPFIK
jgi:hypothetical protein